MTTDVLWAIKVPHPSGHRVHIPAAGIRHAIDMASRWKGDAEVDVWPHSPDLHAAMLRGLSSLFRQEDGHG